jgi:hypothetical protein
MGVKSSIVVVSVGIIVEDAVQATLIIKGETYVERIYPMESGLLRAVPGQLP